MEEQQREIVVIGAGECQWLHVHDHLFTRLILGVVGLSTAIKLQEHGGYKVTIVAETLPSDPKSIRYTSHWAVNLSPSMEQERLLIDDMQGAHYLSRGAQDDKKQQGLGCLLDRPVQA
jgi:hypothetical protein